MAPEEPQRQEPTTDSIAVDTLLARYEQLNHAHYQHNQVIHTTFYLSIVFFAGLLSIVFTADPGTDLIPILSAFGSFVFLLLGVWAWRYNHGRDEIKRRKHAIREEMATIDFDFSTGFDIGDTFFVRHEHSADPHKKVLHTSYYLALAAGSLAIPLLLG